MIHYLTVRGLKNATLSQSITIFTEQFSYIPASASDYYMQV